MDNNNKTNYGWVYLLVFIICVVTSAILIVLFFLNGSSKIEGDGEVETTESIVCDGKNISYPFFDDYGAIDKSIKINVLSSRKKLDAINLVYSMKYASDEAANKSSVSNHIALNESYSDSNLSADSFSARFMSNNDVMQMTLYADARSINGIGAKYFLIDGTKDMTLDTITKNYNDQGLDCVINNEL